MPGNCFQLAKPKALPQWLQPQTVWAPAKYPRAVPLMSASSTTGWIYTEKRCFLSMKLGSYTQHLSHDP